jgi:hypothetical protein
MWVEAQASRVVNVIFKFLNPFPAHILTNTHSHTAKLSLLSHQTPEIATTEVGSERKSERIK